MFLINKVYISTLLRDNPIEGFHRRENMKMRLIPFLEEAAVLEDVVADCYRALAGMTANDALLRDFRQFEREELNHARILRSGKNYVLKAPDAFGKENVDEAELHSGLAAVRAALEQIRKGSIGLREAVGRIRDLENQFEKIHLDTVMIFNDGTLQELFRQLGRDDRDHCQALEEILKTLG